MKRIIKKRARNTSTAHQRIDDHEKLCRIMQEVTNKKIDRLDYYFCALWKQCKGEIWADLTSTLKHIGIKEYTRPPIAKIKEKK